MGTSEEEDNEDPKTELRTVGVDYRAYFAAASIPLASMKSRENDPEIIAKHAFILADAMMREYLRTGTLP